MTDDEARTREEAWRATQRALMAEVLELHKAAGLAPNGVIEVTHAEAVERIRGMRLHARER